MEGKGKRTEKKRNMKEKEKNQTTEINDKIREHRETR